MAREQTAAQRAALDAANRYRRTKANERKTRIALSIETMVRAAKCKHVVDCDSTPCLAAQEAK